MNQRTRTTLMWAFFALLYLVVMLLQTTIFGRLRPLGVKVALMPVVIVCVALQVGHEAGGLFGLIAGFFWYAAGADDGILSMVTFTVLGILSGWLCDNVFSRRFATALLVALGGLLFHQTCVFLLKFYLNDAPGDLFYWVFLTTALSLPACPVIYLGTKAIGKAGGNP